MFSFQTVVHFHYLDVDLNANHIQYLHFLKHITLLSVPILLTGKTH